MTHFQHDCDRCVSLGTFSHEGRDYDLYSCDQGSLGNTVIARYGNEGSEYFSGLWFAESNPTLGEAKKRAIEKGLLGC